MSLAITPANFTNEVATGVTGAVNNANYAGNITSADGGPTLQPVAGAPAGHCVYRATGLDGGPALEYNGTGGHFGGNSTFQTYTNNGAGGGADQPWTCAIRCYIGNISATNHAICFSSSTNVNIFVTQGHSGISPTTNVYQCRRRDDATAAGGGLGVIAGTDVLGATSLVAEFDGTNISLYKKAPGDALPVLVGTVAASTSNSFTPTQLCWANLYRQTSGTPIGSAFTGLISKSLIANGTLANGSDRTTVFNWLEANTVPFVAGISASRVAMIASSTGFGTGVTDAQRYVKVWLASRIDCSLVFDGANVGQTLWETQPTGYTPPAGHGFENPDVATNITAALATSPHLLIYHILSDTALVVNGTYTGVGDMDAYVTTYAIPRLQAIKALCDAAGCALVINYCGQPTDGNVAYAPWITNTNKLIQAAFPDNYWDIQSIYRDTDGTALAGYLQVDNIHPTVATHILLANSLGRRLNVFPKRVAYQYNVDQSSLLSRSETVSATDSRSALIGVAASLSELATGQSSQSASLASILVGTSEVVTSLFTASAAVQLAVAIAEANAALSLYSVATSGLPEDVTTSEVASALASSNVSVFLSVTEFEQATALSSTSALLGIFITESAVAQASYAVIITVPVTQNESATPFETYSASVVGIGQLPSIIGGRLVVPRLLHPVLCVIEILDRVETIQDDDYEEPVQVADRTRRYSVLGQIKWGLDKKLMPEKTGAGEDSDGYILFRRIDLQALEIDDLKQGDRVILMGAGTYARPVDLYVTSIRPEGHYAHGATLLKAFFKDRHPVQQNRGGK